MAEPFFTPESDIPPAFWDTIESVKRDPERLRARLRDLDRGAFVDLFRTYIDARTELIEQLQETEEAEDATEDTLDDLGDAIVAMGRKAYLDAYHQRGDLPDEETWESLPTLVHVFDQVFHERFGSNVFDEIDV